MFVLGNLTTLAGILVLLRKNAEVARPEPATVDPASADGGERCARARRALCWRRGARGAAFTEVLSAAAARAATPATPDIRTSGSGAHKAQCVRSACLGLGARARSLERLRC